MNELEFELAMGGITAPKGFRATGISCGIKEGGYKDLALLVCETPCTTVASFTTNKIKAAPVIYDMEILKSTDRISAILVNSANANCLTGETGYNDAKETAEYTRKLLNITDGEVLIASTGIIGKRLDMNRMKYGIEKLSTKINVENNFHNFAWSIMTTDTREKNYAIELQIGGKTVTIGAAVKGAGMLKPKMEMLHATMLAFITTDAAVSHELLHEALTEAISVSYNRINVDNDTSTNDSVFLLASGMAENPLITAKNEDYDKFKAALIHVCQETAKLMVRDGEGANKLIKLEVVHALTTTDAQRIIKALSESYLVKTAIFGNNPAWGRIVTAIGYSGAKFDLKKLNIYFNESQIIKSGVPDVQNLATAASDMSAMELEITVDLGLGNKGYYAWTCDLSYDYVKINAHYYT